LRPYEVMIIFDADLEEETIRAAVDRFFQLIQSKGAEPGHIDYWGKRRFAYEINHRTEGYYVVLQVPERVYGPPKTASAGTADA